ncbi:MAG: glycosyltransferase [Clostridia bacterium]|nr:glycosyltransferase [Clostridia bacterium]
MDYILHIIAGLKIGGMEKVARDIGLYADKNYTNHYVVFGEEVGQYEEQLKNIGCKIFHIDSPAKNYAAYLKNLKFLMSEYPYTTVHAHTMFNIGWIMLAAKLNHIPVRVSHAHSALTTGKSLKKSVYEFVMRGLIISCSTDLVACGNKAGERLYGKAYAKRGQLILNGIDTAAFQFSEEKRTLLREQLGFQDKFIIGHTGHLADVKNQSFLIEMMPELLKKREDAVLLLLGEGEDRPMLEEKIRTLGLQDKVIMTGNVNNVPEYLCAMDVFAFPSLYEGMPLSILEVQANGLPCVISDRVPKDVFLTDLIHPLPLEDPKAWIDMICMVKRENSEVYSNRMKVAGFDVKTAVEKFYKIYEKGIGS